MRIVSVCILVLALSPASVLAEGVAKLRPATENEIRQTLAGSAGLKDGKNGYQYKAGSSTGYRITDGKVCVRKRSQTSCVTVYSDGKRLEMIDSRGNREYLN